MPLITVADVLKHAEEFERMLGEYFADVAERTTRDGVRLLTDYMSRHESRIVEFLEKLPEEEVHRICSTPLRYEPHVADCRSFEGMELPPDATAADVLDAAILFDECLVRLYRQVAEQPVSEDIKELFEGLIRVEEQDVVELKKIKAADYF